MMLPYALSSSEFGPVITAIEARALPAFSEDRTNTFLMTILVVLALDSTVVFCQMFLNIH